MKAIQVSTEREELLGEGLEETGVEWGGVGSWRARTKNTFEELAAKVSFFYNGMIAGEKSQFKMFIVFYLIRREKSQFCLLMEIIQRIIVRQATAENEVGRRYWETEKRAECIK